LRYQHPDQDRKQCPEFIQEHHMTGYTVHTGSSEKFSQGWDQIFQGQKKPAPKTEAKPAAKKTPKNSKTK